MGKINETISVSQLDDNEYISVVLSDGTLGKIRKVDLIPYTGSEYKSERWIERGWHRIIVGLNNNLANSAILNIANDYGSVTQSFSCFYISGGGYSRRMVAKIGGDGTIFPKVRFVYKKSSSTVVYIDIMYNTVISVNNNTVRIALSSALGLHLTTLSDTIAEIPEGYIVEEFELT